MGIVRRIVGLGRLLPIVGYNLLADPTMPKQVQNGVLTITTEKILLQIAILAISTIRVGVNDFSEIEWMNESQSIGTRYFRDDEKAAPNNEKSQNFQIEWMNQSI